MAAGPLLENLVPALLVPPEAHLYYAYGTLLMTRKHRFARALQEHHEPSLHGHRPWESSFLLMDYLEYAATAPDPIQTTPLLGPGDRVLDIGCGWGMTAIHCARRFRARVTALDRDRDVFPYLQIQAALNGVDIDLAAGDFEQVDPLHLAGRQLVTGADICFWDDLIQPLEQLARQAQAAGVVHLILADPGRAPFHRLARRLLGRYRGQHFNWQALEPRQAEGEILHLLLQAPPALR